MFTCLKCTKTAHILYFVPPFTCCCIWFSLQYVYMYMCDGYSGFIAAPRSFSSLAFCSNEYWLWNQATAQAMITPTVLGETPLHHNGIFNACIYIPTNHEVLLNHLCHLTNTQQTKQERHCWKNWLSPMAITTVNRVGLLTSGKHSHRLSFLWHFA